MRLNEAQELFARTMLDDSGAVDHPDPALAGLFTGGETIVPGRLKIYRSNIMGNLTGALRGSYPLLEKLTGEDFAMGLLRAFVMENPPGEAFLSNYGAGLADFIEVFAPAKGLPYLADVARLEWAMNEAYYAQDDRPLIQDDLQNMPLDTLADTVLPLRPSVRLMESRWPLVSILDFSLKESRGEQETLNLDQGGCRVMVYRPGLSVDIITLEPSEYGFLQAIKAGKTLGQALETALKTEPEFDFQGFLQKHLTLETFSALPANT